MELNLRLWASKYKTGSNGPGPQGSSRWCRASWLSALRSLRGSTWNRSLSRLQRKQRRVMGCGSGAEIICLLLARKMKLHCGTTRSPNTGALGRLFGSDANAKCEYLTIWHQLSFSGSCVCVSSYQHYIFKVSEYNINIFFSWSAEWIDSQSWSISVTYAP